MILLFFWLLCHSFRSFFHFCKAWSMCLGEWVWKVRQGCRKTVDAESQLQYLRLFNFNFFNSSGNGLGCGASFPLIVCLHHSPPNRFTLQFIFVVRVCGKRCHQIRYAHEKLNIHHATESSKTIKRARKGRARESERIKYLCINDGDSDDEEEEDDENRRRILLQIAGIEGVWNRCQRYWAAATWQKQANEQEWEKSK